MQKTDRPQTLFPWQGRLAILFLVVSIVLNCLHYLIFQDGDYIFKFILAQLGFLPISVYLVTVVINQLLGRREKEALLKKLNMVIGSFFSEVGTDLLRYIIRRDKETDHSFRHLQIRADWQEPQYARALSSLLEHKDDVISGAVDLEKLCAFLRRQHGFLLGLLGNANLLEHESFTELLWAVFHLSEELSNRKDLKTLSAKDAEHLVGDIKRVYTRLTAEWIAYMKHLQTDYPFLFSLAVRTNPFNPEARVEIE